MFLPMDALRRIFTKDRILIELQTLYPYLPVEALRRIAQQIADDGEGSSTGFRKVFATLLLTDQADKISLFLNENVNDTDLALQKVAADNAFALRRRTAPDAPLGCFQGWTQSDIEAFEKRQWLFLSPVFDKKQGLKPLDLEDKRILPFTESTEHQLQDHFRGGNSEVFRVKLHPAHYNFDQRWFSVGLTRYKDFMLNANKKLTMITRTSMMNPPLPSRSYCLSMKIHSDGKSRHSNNCKLKSIATSFPYLQLISTRVTTIWSSLGPTEI